MIVRPATLADAAAMRALHTSIIQIGGTTAHLVPFDEAAFVAEYLTPPQTVCCHVACTDQGLIGFQSLGLWEGLPAGWADIGTYVAPGQQRNGAGAALFAATCAAARAAGLTTINAAIRADNSPGLGYYARAGFTDYAAEPDHRLSDGTRTGRILRRFDL